MTLLTRAGAREAGGGGTAGSMRPMIVVVIQPDLQCLTPFLLAGAGPGVEDLVDHLPVEALNLVVVPRGVRADPLVPAGQCFHSPSEVLGPVAVPIARDHSFDPGDRVGGEENQGPAEEPDRGGGLLIVERFGVDQPGAPIGRGMQVDVPDPGPALVSLRCGCAVAVGSSAAAARDGVDFLHIQVQHRPGCLGVDPGRRLSQLLDLGEQLRACLRGGYSVSAITDWATKDSSSE